MAKLFHTQKPDPLTFFNRIHIFLYSAALLALFYHHLTSPISSSSLLLLLSNLLFTLMWALAQPFRWCPIRRQEHLDDLLESYKTKDFPAIDVFVCTADPWKEPPMTVVNTALSVMAYEYPAEKLSVYVSDDGGSELTLFACMEAAKFARYWLPFCKERGILHRSPEAYFEEVHDHDHDSTELKIMYQKMKEKVQSAIEIGHVSSDLVISNAQEYKIFNKWKNGFTSRDHPSVVQALVETQKDYDIKGNPMPNLVYLSREKRPKVPHHFKAGALNALIRVSSLMSNAPVILTLDCDMYSNDPQTPLRALCYILDPQLAPKLAFIQFPQRFKGVNKNGIYGCQILRVFRINSKGLDGLQGPNYVGTGCFFMRRCLHSDLKYDEGSLSSEAVLKKAHEVSGCNYEVGSKWGEISGFKYGSLVEDYLTGFQLHCEGWKSVFCDPERAAFLGDVSRNLSDVLGQCKRWTVGLLEVAFSKYSPLVFGRKVSFLAAMSYAHYSFWGVWSIPVTVYALLPQVALLFDVPLFPKFSDPWFYLYAYLFVAAYAHDLIEFLFADGTIRRWWSDQRMWMIRSLTSYSSGTIEFGLNQLGLSAPGFTVTSKLSEDEQNKRYENGIFNFGVESPFFVLLGIVAIINLSSFIFGVVKATREEGMFDVMFVQLFLSGFGMVNCWPIIEAMFIRMDGGKVPTKTTNFAVLIAGIICILGYIAFAG